MHSDSIDNSPNNLKSRISMDYSPREPSIIPRRHFKLRLKYILSMLTFFFGVIGFIMNDFGLPDIATPLSTEHVGYEFNLTKFTIISKENITKFHIRKYNKTIIQYDIFKKTNYILNLSSMISSSILFILFYFILRKKNQLQEDSIKCNKSSFYVCLIYGICEYFIIIVYIAMLIKLINIIHFISFNIEHKRIIMVTWNHTLKFLKQKENIILLLVLFRGFNMIILTYQLKMLFILNSFLLKETKSEDNKGSPKEMMSLSKNKDNDKNSFGFMFINK